jgi:protein required for attachment to host cells
MKQETLWALVLNTTRARILRGVRADIHDGPAELVLRTPHRALRDIMADKPGRAATSAAGGRRTALEYSSDPVHEDAVAFAKEAVTLLETHRKAGDFDRLAIFASEEMLGIIRKELTDGLKAVIATEVAKNLMHESEGDLMRIVWEQTRRS